VVSNSTYIHTSPPSGRGWRGQRPLLVQGACPSPERPARSPHALPAPPSTPSAARAPILSTHTTSPSSLRSRGRVAARRVSSRGAAWAGPRRRCARPATCDAFSPAQPPPRSPAPHHSPSHAHACRLPPLPCVCVCLCVPEKGRGRVEPQMCGVRSHTPSSGSTQWKIDCERHP